MLPQPYKNVATEPHLNVFRRKYIYGFDAESAASFLNRSSEVCKNGLQASSGVRTGVEFSRCMWQISTLQGSLFAGAPLIDESFPHSYSPLFF